MRVPLHASRARSAFVALTAVCAVAGCEGADLTAPRRATLAPTTMTPTAMTPTAMTPAIPGSARDAAPSSERPPDAVALAPRPLGAGVAPLHAPIVDAPALLAEPSVGWPSSVDALAERFGCLVDGEASGAWFVRFAGYGCASVGASGDTTLLALRPAVASDAAETHSTLVLGPAASSDGGALDVRAELLTSRQLRTGTAPNPWEVAWLVWHYTDDAHFYYFIAKPNGWELGKRDPAYPGGQRFMATGSAPRFAIGEWHDVAVMQHGTTITVRVDGRALVTFDDVEATYTRGNVGVYSEDAAVVARTVRVTP